MAYLPPDQWPPSLLTAWDKAGDDTKDMLVLWGRRPGKASFYALLIPPCPETVRDFFGPGQHLSRGHGCGGTCQTPSASLFLVPNRPAARLVPRLYGPELARLSTLIRQHLPIV